MTNSKCNANDLWREFGTLIDALQSVFGDIGEVWGRYYGKRGVFIIRIKSWDREEAFKHIVQPGDLSLRNSDTPYEKAVIIKAIYDATYEALDEHQKTLVVK